MTAKEFLCVLVVLMLLGLIVAALAEPGLRGMGLR